MENNKESNYIISDNKVFSLQQEIFTLIQAFGLGEEQEKAILYLLNQKILKFLDFHSFIPNNDYVILRKKLDKRKQPAKIKILIKNKK